MPELPDVEGWKRYVARYAKGRRVRRVRTLDPQILRNTSPQGLGRALHGHRLGDPDRHGKWLLVPVGEGTLVVHFGMTGALHWTGRPEEPGAYDRVVLELEGGELRYETRRKLGGLWWVSKDDELTEVTGELGPDAAGLSRAAFAERLAHRRGGLKAALMDQSLLAGIGNELSDELLWHARLRPQAAVRDLDEDRIDALYRSMRQVLRQSMKHGRIPDTGQWLGAVRGDDAATCPRCGTHLRTDRVAGRTAYWCPHCQH